MARSGDIGRKSKTRPLNEQQQPGTPADLPRRRHGETAWSISGHHTGLSDILLTERGERDATQLGESAEKFECFSSDHQPVTTRQADV